MNYSAVFKFIRTYFVPALAVLGFISAVRAVFAGNQQPPIAIPLAPPPAAPFPDFVAGSGLVEANSENISIATQVGGVVASIPVKVGQEVAAGEPLFTIDSRSQAARLLTAEAQIKVAKAQLSNALSLLALVNKVKDMRAVSEELMVQRKANADIASAELARAQAAADQDRVELERLTVRAPIAGAVLQIKARVGEFAAAARDSGDALMVFGAINPLNIRVDIDENDSWRMEQGAAAVGYLRGNSTIRVDLSFVRFEPYIVPKKSLTGESSERVDTRVFQAIYNVKGRDLPIYVGQLLDVYVQAAPNP